MKDITIKNEKKFIIVRVDAKGEPNGILTHKVSRYGSSKAVSPFNLSNLSNAVQSSGSESLQSELEAFISKKKNYNYALLYHTQQISDIFLYNLVAFQILYQFFQILSSFFELI